MVIAASGGAASAATRFRHWAGRVFASRADTNPGNRVDADAC
jgi:hypothetical protein